MAESKGMHSAGTVFYVSSYSAVIPPTGESLFGDWAEGTPLGAPGDLVWRAVGEVIDADGIAIQPSTTRLTHLRSPGKAHEKVPGFKDGGQLRLRFNYHKKLFAALLTLVPGDANTPDTPPDWGRKSFAVAKPDGGTYYLRGFVAGNPITIPEDDRITIELTIEIHGLPTYVA